MATLAQTYNAGSSAANQTMTIDPAKGGAVIVKAHASGTGSLIEVLTSAAAKLLDITDNAAQTVRSFMADGAAAVALVVDTGAAWSNATAKLQSWKNNAIEKAYMLATGDFYVGGMALENLPGFGSPMVRGQQPNGFMSFTSDGVGPLWGGTGLTVKSSTSPEISSVVLTVDDQVVAGAVPGVFTANKFGAGAGQTISIVGNTLTPSSEFGAVSFVGAGLIKTITAENQSYWIEIIPTDTFSWDTTGNIALAGTAAVGRLLRFWHDGGTGLWYPSYT